MLLHLRISALCTLPGGISLSCTPSRKEPCLYPAVIPESQNVDQRFGFSRYAFWEEHLTNNEATHAVKRVASIRNPPTPPAIFPIHHQSITKSKSPYGKLAYFTPWFPTHQAGIRSRRPPPRALSTCLLYPAMQSVLALRPSTFQTDLHFGRQIGKIGVGPSAPSPHPKKRQKGKRKEKTGPFTHTRSFLSLSISLSVFPLFPSRSPQQTSQRCPAARMFREGGGGEEERDPAGNLRTRISLACVRDKGSLLFLLRFWGKGFGYMRALLQPGSTSRSIDEMVASPRQRRRPRRKTGRFEHSHGTAALQ
ncbi:hypothetical protein LZ30DRAFT_170837 [Colletotrichum cereale]|nr:hypothetical protein LZ30DRAFT_170837 [Colletotrichum cereale]